MFFNSTRGPLCIDAPQAAPYCGYGDFDIWASYRKHVHDDFGWETPINVGPGVNTKAFEAGAAYFENEDGKPLLYFGRGGAGFPPGVTNPTTDIWVAELQPGGTFGAASLVPNINFLPDREHPLGIGDQRPSIRFDGLEIVFFSNRPGSVSMPNEKNPSTDIWVATRRSVEDPWDAPVRLANEVDPTSPFDTRVNTEAGEINPQLSPDGLALYFASSRSKGCGGFDIYVTTRTRLKGQEERQNKR
jgi:hypothetical protein